MGKLIFWDVDTQYDFMKPDGKLYVPGAEALIPNLAQLTLFARHHGIRVLGSVDWHKSSDPEISLRPDFKETFPEHCLQGSPGSEKIPETTPQNPLWIEPQPQLWKEMERKVRSHSGEIFFRKNRFDVFSNPNVNSVLGMIVPDEIVVYGVALDVCNAHAVEGFLKREEFRVTLVQDASQPISESRAKELVIQWKSRGVKVIQTADVMKGSI